MRNKVKKAYTIKDKIKTKIESPETQYKNIISLIYFAEMYI
ncbi:MAG: hypothetical protein WCR29_04845 [Bacteroidales bacterium]